MSPLELVALGGLLGAVGQTVRVIVGAKKLADRASQNRTSFAEEFHPSELTISLIIGFAAGVLAVLGLTSVSDAGSGAALAAGSSLAAAGTPELSRSMMLGVMAAGYAGTDFIEGFAKKYLPTGKAAPDQTEAAKPPAQIGEGSAPQSPPPVG